MILQRSSNQIGKRRGDRVSTAGSSDAWYLQVEMRQKEELPQRKRTKSTRESSRRRLDDELLRLFPGELGATEVTVASSLEVNGLLEVELANYEIPVRSAINWY